MPTRAWHLKTPLPTVKSNNFDGIDIDFEAKQDTTRDYFSTFLRGLYSRMAHSGCTAPLRRVQPLIDRYAPAVRRQLTRPLIPTIQYDE